MVERAHGPDDEQGAFAWQGREEGGTYLAAIASYVAVGVVLRTAVLNWIVGPLYFVCFVWVAALLLGRRRGGRP